MEDDTWRSSSNSRSYLSALKSLSDLCIEDDADEITAEYPCPYCTEDLDLIDLCSHIEDEHTSFEDRPEVCPVCASKVVNLVTHIKTSHGNILKSLQLQKDYSYAIISRQKKEFNGDYLQALLGGSSAVPSSKTTAPDPLLSFLCSAPAVDKSPSIHSGNSIEANLEEKSADVQVPPLSDKEHMEKTKRSEFVQGLLFSAIVNSKSNPMNK